MQQEMLLRDEETMELRGTYSSLQQEVEVKTKKLKKVRCPAGETGRCPRVAGPKRVCLKGPSPLLNP